LSVLYIRPISQAKVKSQITDICTTAAQDKEKKNPAFSSASKRSWGAEAPLKFI